VAIDARRDPEAADPVRRRAASTPTEAAKTPAAPPLSGRAKPSRAAQAKSCSPPWIPTACAPASTANSPPPSAPPSVFPSSPPEAQALSHHFADVFGAGKADAALAASIFHFGVSSARSLKEELANAGIP
jgi:hypothetical protein